MPRPVAARAAAATSASVRQRIVFCDCFDCQDRAAPLVLTDAALAASERVARQLPPPKSIVLFGTGLMHSLQGSHSLDECTLPHLDTLVKEGCLGVVALRETGATDGMGGGVRELGQLCGVHEDLDKAAVQGGVDAPATSATLPSFASMHKGMQVLASTNSLPARELLGALGAVLPSQLQLQGTSDAEAPAAVQQQQQEQEPPAEGQGSVVAGWAGQELGLPVPADYAGQLLLELGVGEGSSGPDLLLVHVDALTLSASQAHVASSDTDTQQPGSQAGDVSAQGDGNLWGDEAVAGVDAAESSLHESACGGLLWLDALLSALMRRQEVKEEVLLAVILTPATATHAGGTTAGGSGTSASPVTAANPGEKFGLQSQQSSAALLSPGQLLDPGVQVVTPRDMTALMSNAGAGRGLSMLDESASQAVPLVPRPLQSWQLRGLQQVAVDVHAPGLCARRLPGVVRRDRAEQMSVEEAAAKGGGGGILIDRLLPEIAYKLGRAPKYGA